MFLQGITTRVAVIVTGLMISVTGIAYGVGHLSDRPLILAYVEQFGISDNSLFAYLVDPERRHNIPLRIPSGYRIASPGLRPDMDVYYLTKEVRDAESAIRKRIQLLYRYNVRTGDMQLVYDSSAITDLVGFSAEFVLLSSLDHRYYAFVDRYEQAVVILSRDTLETNIVWRREPADNITDSPVIWWSPESDKIAIYDRTNGSIITIVDLAGNVLNQFPVIDITNPTLGWLDEHHLLLTTWLGSPDSEDAPIQVYNTVSGELHPHANALKGRFPEYFPFCRGHGEWIAFFQEVEDNVGHLFTLNLTTGDVFELDAMSHNLSEVAYVLLQSNSDCSLLIKRTFISNQNRYDSNNVYLTTLEADNPRKVVEDAVLGYVGPDDTMLYAKPNEDGSYTLFRLFVDGTDRVESLQYDVPTRNAVYLPGLIERGWYAFLENEWERPQSVLPRMPGNPLIYYDIETLSARVLTPLGVRISNFVVLP